MRTESENIISDSDIIFCLDFNNLKRLGDMKALIENSNSYKILIDHHENPNLVHPWSKILRITDCCY